MADEVILDRRIAPAISHRHHPKPSSDPFRVAMRCPAIQDARKLHDNWTRF
ncbi:hypothetical protein [Bosea massiliensis]|uniref:Uncharacterized protein n=1 Tax=Bosea massiliensis TaxID=151419 RepID=A0ABW0P2S3_9HYPH